MMRTAARHFGVLAIGFALYFATGPRLVWHPTDRLRERGDSLLNAWIMAWVAHALTTPGCRVWDPPAFHPAPNMLCLSETMFGTLWYSLPINVITGNPVLAANVHILLSFVLCFFATYLLVRGLTGSEVAGVAAGTTFSFNPIRWDQLGHMNLLAFYFAPVALLYWHRFLRKGRPRDFFAAVVLLAGQYYLSINLGTLTLTLLLVYLFAHCSLERRGRDRWFLFGRWRLILAGAGLFVALLAPLAPAYLRVVAEWDVTRSVADNVKHSCEPLGLLAPVSDFASYGGWGPAFAGVRGRCWLGFTPWLAAAAAIALRHFRTDQGAAPVGCLAVTATACAVFMLGPELIWNDRPTGVPLPHLFVYYGVPGATGMRVPSRFFLPLLLCLSALTGALVAYVVRAGWGSTPIGRALAVASVIAWLGIDYRARDYDGVTVPPRSNFPPVNDYLAAGPRDAPILELPADCHEQFEFQYYQTAHWRPRVNGESGTILPPLAELMARTGSPTDATAHFLSLTPARTVVVHLDRYDVSTAAGWEWLPLQVHGFRRVGLIGNALVWERESPHPETASRLRVVGLNTVANPDNPLRRRLSVRVTPSGANPWRLLDRGTSDIAVTITVPGQAPNTLRRRIAVPPYLLPGEEASIAVDLPGLPCKPGTRVHIEGRDVETYDSVRDR